MLLFISLIKGTGSNQVVNDTVGYFGGYFGGIGEHSGRGGRTVTVLGSPGEGDKNHALQYTVRCVDSTYSLDVDLPSYLVKLNARYLCCRGRVRGRYSV